MVFTMFWHLKGRGAARGRQCTFPGKFCRITTARLLSPPDTMLEWIISTFRFSALPNLTYIDGEAAQVCIASDALIIDELSSLGYLE